jgi:hypothetical protein
MNGFRPNSKERKERARTCIFAKGYHKGTQDERNRIVEALLKDAVIITNLDVELLERVIEIVEG